MKSAVKTVLAATASALIASSCGMNPWGANMGSFGLFTKVGKAMQKPSAINDQNSKDDAAQKLADGAQKRLAKVQGADLAGVSSSEIVTLGPDSFKYMENMTDKPSEEDPQKLLTGRAEVVFGYSGDPNVNFLRSNLTNLYSFSFVGREVKTWKKWGTAMETCSLRLNIDFATSTISDPVPGYTTAWGMNISDARELGQGDTTEFTLAQMVADTQTGGGVFFDKYTGYRSEDPSSRAFSYDLRVVHKATPADYSDNEGIVTFTLPYGADPDFDSVYFVIHFRPNYEREGWVHEQNRDGAKRVHFFYNEKSLSGFAVYYNKDGEEIEREIL